MIQRVKECQVSLEDTLWSPDGLASWRDIESNCGLIPCLPSTEYEAFHGDEARVHSPLSSAEAKNM
jgi:hypothetical protein